MNKYVPGTGIDVEQVQTPELGRYLQQELALISDALNAAVERRYNVLGIEPTRPRQGMQAYANGSDWNPGRGESPYVYKNGQWQQILHGETFTISGAATIGGNLGVGGNLSVTGTLAAGATTLASLVVSGTATITGVLTANGGAKIGVQNTVDGGSSRGIFMWSTSDTNWGIYMAQSGLAKALNDGTAPTSLDGRTGHHMRFRVAQGAVQGFIWENHGNVTVASLTGDTGDFHALGSLLLGSGGSTAAGSISASTSYGMAFRSKVASPTVAEMAWFISSGVKIGEINSTNLELFQSIGVKARQLTSTVTTGVAPLVVTSTTGVTNLNADYVDGYHAAEAATASTVVARNSAGYAFAVYFNQSSGDENSAASHYFYMTGSDGYHRRKTLANVKAEILQDTGTYTPTFTNVANMLSAGVRKLYYVKHGDKVFVQGRINVNVNNVGQTNTRVGISLPIASNFTSIYDASGVGAGPAHAGIPAFIYGDTANDRVTLDYNAVAFADDWYIWFIYQIL